eukprot:TRINITY_DN5662_c0_g1_i2.p1 TRINITY_DN5662_c0_g1~~TRINITY_DN5662_c0_g1_i2.p1  ORF type:complete len:229 (-),score=8.90 TRINITY_DN5662_c0_g1_i2:740-1426(-)
MPNSLLAALPDDIWLLILAKCSPSVIATFAQLSHECHRFSLDDHLWRCLCERDNVVSRNLSTSTPREHYIQSFSYTMLVGNVYFCSKQQSNVAFDVKFEVNSEPTEFEVPVVGRCGVTVGLCRRWPSTNALCALSFSTIANYAVLDASTLPNTPYQKSQAIILHALSEPGNCFAGCKQGTDGALLVPWLKSLDNSDDPLGCGLLRILRERLLHDYPSLPSPVLFKELL